MLKKWFSCWDVGYEIEIIELLPQQDNRSKNGFVVVRVDGSEKLRTIKMRSKNCFRLSVFGCVDNYNLNEFIDGSDYDPDMWD